MAGVEVNGLAGLYLYFLLLATAWMEDGGLAAWLIPSEFMDVNYGSALKRFLCDRVTLIRIHRFDPHDVQFGDAFVSSAILLFRKTPPPTEHAVEFTFGGTIAKPHASEAIPFDRLRASRKWTTHPKDANNDRHISGDGDGPALADFFRIQRGIATGCNKFFVLERTAAARRGLPKRYLRLMLHPDKALADTLRQHPERGSDVLGLLGQVTGQELRGEGRVYGGGLHKIEPSELGRVSAAGLVQRWPELAKSVQRQKMLS